MKTSKHELIRRFKFEKNAYQEVRALCMAEVVRWRYSQGMAWAWHPNIKDYRDKKPSSWRWTEIQEEADYAYGYDAQDRVRIVQWPLRMCREDGWRRPIEDFLRYSENRIEISEFDELKLRFVENVTLHQAHPVKVEEFDSDSVFELTSFEWRGDLLMQSRRRVPQFRLDIETVFDSLGRVKEEFEVKQDGTRVLAGDVIRPIPKGVTLKSLTDTVHKRLLISVPKTIRKAKLRGRFYCLALAYDGEGNGALPPTIGLGLESERTKWMRNEGPDAKGLLWNPAEFQHYEKPHTQINDEELQQACDWFNHKMERKGSDAPARKLLNTVAAELGRMSWKGKLNVTGDFIAFAVDFEGRDLEENMRLSASPRKLALLKRAGFL